MRLPSKARKRFKFQGGVHTHRWPNWLFDNDLRLVRLKYLARQAISRPLESQPWVSRIRPARPLLMGGSWRRLQEPHPIEDCLITAYCWRATPSGLAPNMTPEIPHL